MKLIKLLCLCALSFNLLSCSRESDIPSDRIETVQAHTFSNQLFYTGIIQPLKTIVIPSPADGAVIDLNFQYGEVIQAGQLLFHLSSNKFMADYKAALLQYIKAKSDFNNNKTQLSEAQFLHKNLLISDDDFKMKESNFYTAQLAFLQAKDALDALVKQLNVKSINVDQLAISDIDKITQALHLEPGEDLPIFAPASGVVLSAFKNEEETRRVGKGDAIKQGDVLAVIGDMSGITVHIKVDELTINQLKPGQDVTVTGIAFADEILKGKIQRVDHQAEVSTNGLPTFPVEIVVSQLTSAQQKKIHVGMSAKVEINAIEPPTIEVAINALKENHGQYYVTIYDEHHKKTHEVPVKTGKTNMNSVTILAGLKSGDKIVLPG